MKITDVEKIHEQIEEIRSLDAREARCAGYQDLTALLNALREPAWQRLVDAYTLRSFMFSVLEQRKAVIMQQLCAEFPELELENE